MMRTPLALAKKPVNWLRQTTAGALLAAGAFTLLPATAHAQLQLVGQSGATGGGLGSVLTVLTLQNPGGTTAESGCVGLTGFTGCGFTNSNVQSGQSQLQPLGSLTGVTGSTFRLFLNAAEPGNDNMVVVNNLVLTLYGQNNTTFTANLPGTTTLTNTLQGTGNYGFLFGLSASSAAAFDAFIAANPNASIGAGASFSEVSGGLETISVGRASQTQVPEPNAWLLLGSGLAALTYMTIQRRRV